MKLTIALQVKDKIEAYQIVSRLGFRHKISEADLDGYKEIFDEENQPNMFLCDNDKIKKDVFKKVI